MPTPRPPDRIDGAVLGRGLLLLLIVAFALATDPAGCGAPEAGVTVPAAGEVPVGQRPATVTP